MVGSLGETLDQPGLLSAGLSEALRCECPGGPRSGHETGFPNSSKDKITCLTHYEQGYDTCQWPRSCASSRGLSPDRPTASWTQVSGGTSCSPSSPNPIPHLLGSGLSDMEASQSSQLKLVNKCCRFWPMVLSDAFSHSASLSLRRSSQPLSVLQLPKWVFLGGVGQGW